MLGLAVGDATGAPFEGMGAYDIYQSFGSGTRFVRKPPVDVLSYTDDTQMMIALAEHLIEHQSVDEDALMQAFVDNYDPGRGYGSGARTLLETAGTGGDWKTLSHTLFPGGSLGNGAAMRVAPIGLRFHDDLDRVAQEAERSALPTHRHPIGIDGARLIALAVALALRPGAFDRAAFLDELARRAATEEFQHQLTVLANLGPLDPFDFLGSSIRADRSVATAIGCFARWPDSYADTISHAISLGDDTDTVAAMAGAISGARLGIAGIPKHLLDMFEDRRKGRTYIDDLASRIARLCD